MFVNYVNRISFSVFKVEGGMLFHFYNIYGLESWQFDFRDTG